MRDPHLTLHAGLIYMSNFVFNYKKKNMYKGFPQGNHYIFDR